MLTNGIRCMDQNTTFSANTSMLRDKARAAYSMALDGSTDKTDSAQLAIFIRGMNEQFKAVCHGTDCCDPAVIQLMAVQRQGEDWPTSPLVMRN
ncbi:hypothetical protein F2P81_002465 [Scophthalmus maximus]|uniref:Uncharacterized protein n=1 Tax=Scophthalmus maximus TaxID=52904 RepID=A0A6A4TEG1_SCOMX|nr:hypothetical protein F2P81_002465 [Scophthalmus maximus]